MAELTVTVERLADRAAFVVRSSGPLTASNRHLLRGAVQKYLTEMPAAVVLDLTGVHLADRIAAAVFVALRREAMSTGPGVALLLCRIRDVFLERRIRALLPRLPIYADLPTAVDAISHTPSPSPSVLSELPPGLGAPITAGVTIVAACQRWDLVHLQPFARATAFELGMTALRCPPGPISMSAVRDTSRLRIGLRVRVVDPGPSACAKRPAHNGYHHKVTPTGHLVWATLPIRPPEPSGQPPPS